MEQEFIFPVADGAAKLFGRDHGVRESTLRNNLQGAKNFKETRRGLNRQKQKMTLKPALTLRQSQVTSFIVVTSTPRVQCFVPTEETFVISLKCIAVTRTTHKSTCMTRTTYRRLLDCRCGSQFVRLMDRIQEVHTIERKTSQRMHAVRGAAYEDSSNYQT